jgi:transposase-like protein
MAGKPTPLPGPPGRTDPALAGLACPNPDCCDCNRFGAGNLSVVEWTGKHKDIRRLYCCSCGHRFSERQGTLLQYTKLPEETVVRVVKCLGHGCSIAAAADICDVDPRTVGRLLEQAGRRAADFHELQRERLATPLEVVQLDELHGRVSPTPAQKGGRRAGRIARIALGVARGLMRPWPSAVGS